MRPETISFNIQKWSKISDNRRATHDRFGNLYLFDGKRIITPFEIKARKVKISINDLFVVSYSCCDLMLSAPNPLLKALAR